MDMQDSHLLLSDDDEKLPLESGKRPCKSTNRPSRIILYSIAIVTVLFLAYAIFIYLPDRTGPTWTDCGGSPEEARNRGCKFDLLSFAWQTPECYDQELLQEFLDYDDWEYFTSKEGNETATLEAARKGEQTLYATETYHFVHCTFMWMQMHRAYTVLGYIDNHLDAYNHTLHCQRILFNRGDPPSSVTTVGLLKYPSCRRIY